jgi:membrane protein implicated in regulation of membrane protease activity
MANSVGSSGGFLSGEKTVTSAGTAEALETTVDLVESVVIIAKAANTGQVFVGGTDVASTTNDGLDAGDSISLSSRKGFKLSNIFIDVGVSGEGVDIYAVK